MTMNTTPIQIAEARPARPAASWKSKLLLSLGTFLAIVVLLEIGFRVYDVFSPKGTKLANPFLLFRGGIYDFHTLFKTPEQVVRANGRKVLRIVCIGGSTTQD